jgi:uncharacterized membrane protein
MRHFLKPNFLLYFILIFFGLIFFTIVIKNHYFFRTYAFDYGSYNFAFWDYSHFQISKCPNYYGANLIFLQDHFSFTLMYLVPLYWILNWLTGSYTLLIINIVIILASGWFLYKLILSKTDDVWLGLAALIQYFTLQGRYSAFASDCNLAIISACMVPIFLYAFESKKYVIASIIYTLALFSRENMSLWFIFIFFILLIWHRKEHKTIRILFLYILISIIYFILLFKLFIPLIEAPDKKYGLFNFSCLGKDPFESLLFIIKHPLDTLSLLFRNQSNEPYFNDVKSEFYWVYFISGGFIIFYRPQYLIWFVPLIAFKMFNDVPVRWGIETYYSIEVVTILPITIFVIVHEFKNKVLRYYISLIICILTISVTIVKFMPEHRKYGCDIEKEFVFINKSFQSDLNIKEIHGYLKLIPEKAKVSASTFFLPHLAQRQFIYYFPDVNDAEYIVAVQTNGFYLMTGEQYSKEINKYLYCSDWNIIAENYPFIMFKKEHNKKLNKNSFICNAEKVTVDKNQFIASNNTKLEFGKYQSSDKSHSGKYSIKLTKDNIWGMSFKLIDVTKGEKMKLTVWRFSPDNKGFLVASAKSSDDFYIAGNHIIQKDIYGWQLIELDLNISKTLIDNTLYIYLWNDGNSDVYFDDITLIRN